MVFIPGGGLCSVLSLKGTGRSKALSVPKVPPEQGQGRCPSGQFEAPTRGAQGPRLGMEDAG